MHDITFAKEIITVTKHRLGQLKKSPKAIRINAKLSCASHVTPEHLKDTFRSASQGTGLEKAELNIEILPIELECAGCGSTLKTEKPIEECPECGGSDISPGPAREFFVESIEIEE
ncbi:MAG: hydrogenase maturation nickel metallochaperone HypA [Candidatus Omnitrophota bacterium]